MTAILVSTNEGVAHKDSFGFLTSVLVGGSTWTDRLLRGTKMAAPHIAKNDVFCYKAQINHDKILNENLDGFHVHIIPIGAVTGNVTAFFDYAYSWLTNGDTFPNTLAVTGTCQIDLVAGDQYKYLIKPLITYIAPPANEGYSSEIFLQFTRRNDGTDTYAGEFALIDGDVHYTANKVGSVSEFNDVVPQ